MQWSGQFDASPAVNLPGDKILLPPSALEQLLAAAPTVSMNERSSGRALTSTFDPYNPYTYAAERQARAQSEYQQQQLPQPLTFRLVNPDNGRVVYAGIREFSAADGAAGLSQFLLQALGIKSNSQTSADNDTQSPPAETAPRITAHYNSIPKGTYVKLRPIEAGYDPEDWKSLLEEHLRRNFTTLTRGELLKIPSGRRIGTADQTFDFLIDSFVPEGDSICVVDTDLEVDIEPLNEEQARETVKKIAAKARGAQDSNAQSVGGELNLFKSVNGKILPGNYVDYELPSWDKSRGISIELSSESRETSLELFASPLNARQRAKPREDEHVFCEIDDRPTKRLRLSSTNVELENAESLYIAVYAPESTAEDAHEARQFTLRAVSNDSEAVDIANNAVEKAEENADSVRCKNCAQLVPQQSFRMHEAFCYRNNILCPKGCGEVFQKRSPAWDNHWHCPHDDSFGFTQDSHKRHDEVFHQTHQCPKCNFEGRSLLDLAQHRTSTCPGKLILCRFCHLIVPQEGDADGTPDPEALLAGLTPHELADGGRTTECHLCQRIVRLRDMDTHLKNHEYERLNRSSPRVCRNVNCGRTLDGVSRTGDTRAGARMGQGSGNDIGLCSICFGPLYVSMHDPEGKALKRRVERKYLTQLLTGCGKAHCHNGFCKTGHKNIGANGAEVPTTTKDALPFVKPFVDGLLDGSTPLHFCVDEASQTRRNLAHMLAAEGETALPGQQQYAFEWCVGALEAEGGKLDAAREWLHNFAPAKNEAR